MFKDNVALTSHWKPLRMTIILVQTKFKFSIKCLKCYFIGLWKRKSMNLNLEESLETDIVANHVAAAGHVSKPCIIQ